MSDDQSTEQLLARIKLLESKLEASERHRKAAIDENRAQALREISGGISHNLNNLLTGMLLQAELISAASKDPEVLECVRDIIHTGRRGADLVARLGLALREKVLDDPHPVVLKDVVDEAVENSRAIWQGESNLEGRKVDLVANIPEDLPPVQATGSGLIDIVIDLIKNANEALPDGGSIEISASREGEFVRLSIRDDGIGMDADTLRRATLPFFTTKRDVGSGLGLSTTEGLLDSWGGALDIASTPGRGTSAIVALRVAE